jgi:hypothetical protein
VVYDATVPAATVVARAGGQLILTDPNSEQWRELVATASTFSCSVGPALPRVLGPLLLTLPERPQGRRPVRDGATLRFSWVTLEGDAKSSLGDFKSSLGDFKSSLGDAESSLGDAKSSLGDFKSSLGDTRGLAG